MHRFLTAILSTAAICAAAVLPAAAGTPITIGTGSTSDTLAVLVADQEGIFAKNGLDSSVKVVRGASGLIAGVFSGDFQFIMSNQAQLLVGVNGGVDLVVVAGGPRTNQDNDPVALVARPDVKYDGPADLVGKKIAISGFDSGTYFTLRKWLEEKGVDHEKIDWVESSMPVMSDALQSKQVEFAASVDPFVEAMVKDGIARVVAKYNTEYIKEQPAIFWVSMRPWATEHMDIVNAFRKSLDEAKDYIAANPDRAREIEKAAFHANKKNLPNPDTHVTADDLEVYYQIGKKIGLYDKDIDTSTLILN